LADVASDATVPTVDALLAAVPPAPLALPPGDAQPDSTTVAARSTPIDPMLMSRIEALPFR
jgi:hypothetical protein